MSKTIAASADELKLLAQAIEQPAAFATIYDRYFARIYNYTRYRLRDAQAADELTAQIFEQALRQLGSYRADRAPFEVWLLAIARNAVSDHLRAQRRQRWFPLDSIKQWASPSPQPEELAIEGETRHELLAALERLGERERDLLALKFAAQLTNRRIAALTGLRESNVGVIIYRALQRLRAELESPGGPQ